MKKKLFSLFFIAVVSSIQTLSFAQEKNLVTLTTVPQPVKPFFKTISDSVSAGAQYVVSAVKNNPKTIGLLAAGGLFSYAMYKQYKYIQSMDPLMREVLWNDSCIKYKFNGNRVVVLSKRFCKLVNKGKAIIPTLMTDEEVLQFRALRAKFAELDKQSMTTIIASRQMAGLNEIQYNDYLMERTVINAEKICFNGRITFGK